MNSPLTRGCAVLITLAFLWLSPVACGGAQLSAGTRLTGMATYYADSLAGRPTASGEPYDPDAMTAAHRDLPFGTIVKVTNLKNMQSVKVRINDRGPFGKRRRLIDLSKAAAKRLDMLSDGVVEVRIEVLQVP